MAVIIPARNEASTIAASIQSLEAQDYRGQISIIVIDDNSTDGTGAIAASVASERVTVLRGEPLPGGWSGKLWAVHQGLSHPKTQSAEYVLLTDADIEHAPGHLSALLAKAEDGSLDLVSEMVRLNGTTLAERALIPAFVLFFQMLYPFAWVNDPKARTAGAAGGTMLVRRTALDRIDGVTRIRHRLIDDCALASEIKRSGGRIWLGHSELAISQRVYPHWRDIWNMIARTAYEQLDHSPLMLLGCIAAMGIVYCSAPVLALAAHRVPRLLALATWIIVAAVFQPTLRRYRRSPLWGLALPAICLFYMGATIASAIRHHTGLGGGWKERVYAGDPR